MTCPVCGAETRIVNSRKDDCDRVRRRRECRECGHRFTTVEYEIETKRGRPKHGKAGKGH